MLWKIYFWIVIALLLFACFVEGFSEVFFVAGPIWGTLSIIFLLVSLLVLFLYSHKIKILNSTLWKVYLPIIILWDFLYGVLIEPLYMEEQYGMDEIILGYLIISIPMYVAIYLYGFRFFDHEEKSAKEIQFESNDENMPKFQYPGLLRRYLATFLDGVVIIGVFIVVSYIFQHNAHWSNYIRLGTILFMFFIYEPVCTSRYCTIGQKVMGIRVRKQILHENISITSAYLRIIVKLFLGLISFFTIPFSVKKRAIHDFAVDSVVIYAKPVIA